jgi:hypothetical protein
VTEKSCGERNRICLGVAMAQNGRGALDIEVVPQLATLEEFAGQAEFLARQRFAPQPIRVQQIACEIQRWARFQPRLNPQPVRLRAELVQGRARANPRAFGGAFAELARQVHERCIQLELQQRRAGSRGAKHGAAPPFQNQRPPPDGAQTLRHE